MLCVLDTTQATSSNRLKIYINGIQITDFGTANYPAQDSTWNINTNVEHGIGGSSAIQDFDGYMAEVHFIDGQANPLQTSVNLMKIVVYGNPSNTQELWHEWFLFRF
jgi:hypothetical protein